MTAEAAAAAAFLWTGARTHEYAVMKFSLETWTSQIDSFCPPTDVGKSDFMRCSEKPSTSHTDCEESRNKRALHPAERKRSLWGSERAPEYA